LFAQPLAVTLLDFAQGITPCVRPRTCSWGAKNGSPLEVIFGFFLQNMRHRLGDSEIAGGHQHQHAIFRAPEGRHFAMAY
jgi:hypothetical protein